MTSEEGTPTQPAHPIPLVIATILREEGSTGVHTHVREVRRYMEGRGVTTSLVTPFSWGGALTVPVFGARLALKAGSTAAGVMWYRHWHESFLRNALQHHLSGLGAAVLYAQTPEAARACLRARAGPHQQVVMAVHYQFSQADGWVDKKYIKREGMVYRNIREMEREVIPQLDGLLYVSRSTRDCLLRWLPLAGEVPSEVIPNFVEPIHPQPDGRLLADLVTVGGLEYAKNHSYLLEVLAQAKREGKTFSLDIYGDGPMRRQLVRLASSLGIGKQVRFCGFRPGVRYLLPRYRAYVHASWLEAAPLSIIEAMAAGLPIVAASVGGVGEAYDEGKEGLFWPLDDPERAAAILGSLLGSEPARLKASAAASERFRRDFDATVVGPKLMSFLFDNVLANTGGSRGAAGDATLMRTKGS